MYCCPFCVLVLSLNLVLNSGFIVFVLNCFLEKFICSAAKVLLEAGIDFTERGINADDSYSRMRVFGNGNLILPY